MRTLRLIFLLQFSLAKQNLPTSDTDADPGFRKKRGTDIPSCLHSTFSATNIVEHISFQIRNLFYVAP
jgi:hypothetical protein